MFAKFEGWEKLNFVENLKNYNWVMKKAARGLLLIYVCIGIVAAGVTGWFLYFIDTILHNLIWPYTILYFSYF